MAGSVQSLGLVVGIFDPTIDTATPLYTPAGQKINFAVDDVSSLTFQLEANGGYFSGDLMLEGSREFIENWIQNGLNRHIEIRNPALDRIFTGFVNSLTATIGGLSVQRGPLMDVANRASVVYTPILDATVDPPVVGTKRTTTVADDSDSIALYGIMEDVLSAGTVEATTAEQIRDTYLQENSWPQTTERLTVGGGSNPRVTLRCLGYVHRLKKWVYNTTTTGTVTVTTKLQAVLTADPNGMFSTDYSGIATNAFLATSYDNDDRMAWDVLMSLVEIGDVNDDRYTFGIYNDRKAQYLASALEDTRYEHRLSERAQIIETVQHAQVEHWDVLPANWLFFPDFLIHTSPPASRRKDPRYLFIESTTFRTPDTLNINGIKIERLPQLLAKFGSGGGK